MLSLGQDGAARNAHQYIFNYIHYWNDTEIAVFGEIYLYFDLLKADLTVGGTSYSFLVVGLEPDRVPVDYFMNKNRTVKENIERRLVFTKLDVTYGVQPVTYGMLKATLNFGNIAKRNV